MQNCQECVQKCPLNFYIIFPNSWIIEMIDVNHFFHNYHVLLGLDFFLSKLQEYVKGGIIFCFDFLWTFFYLVSRCQCHMVRAHDRLYHSIIGPTLSHLGFTIVLDKPHLGFKLGQKFNCSWYYGTPQARDMSVKSKQHICS